MENAVDAIVMAGEVLIFIVALTICISSLNTLKDTLDNIIGEDETIELASTTTTDDTTGETSIQYLNYIASKKDNATRVVGAETVVTSMYRALKEEYTLYIKFSEGTKNEISNIKAPNEIEDIFIKLDPALVKDQKILIEKNTEVLMIGYNEKLKITSHLNELLR